MGKPGACGNRYFQKTVRNLLIITIISRPKDNTIYVIEEDDEIRAMLQLNPYQVKLQESVVPSDYIVGVATQAEYRGRGYMRIF